MATAVDPQVEREAEREARRQRLRTDGIYYAEKCIRLVDLHGDLVPLVARKGQRRIEEAIAEQEAANEPVRIMIDKARRVGSSTWAIKKLIEKLTQHENSQGQITAQDRGTGSELFDIAKMMWQNLPQEPWLKPPLYQQRDSQDSKFLWWGEPSKYERDKGNLGLNSKLTVDNANVITSGRGRTIRFLLCTEVAHWPDPKKALGLLNAVSDVPGTLIIIESTPNGFDELFKPMWDRAEAGESAYKPIFIGWHDVEHFTLPFANEDERAAFIDSIGTGPWGEDEPSLQEVYGCTPEQLHWRRRAIVDKAQGKLELFRQEYASNPAESFIGSGKHVFSVVFTAKAIQRTEAIEQLPVERGGPEVGVLDADGFKDRKINDGTIQVPTGALWVPSEKSNRPIGHDFWVRWHTPPSRAELTEAGYLRDAHGKLEMDVGGPQIDMDALNALIKRRQFIVAVDPASGDANTWGEQDYHAIQVIDHRTREQAARLQTRSLDPDEVAYQALLAAMLFNEALISVETTGGYGMPIVRKLWDAYGWRRVYKRKAIEGQNAKTTDRLGWDTNRRTKPLMVDGLREMLREGVHGLRDHKTALELNTFVVDERGHQGADKSAHDDLLMAYMQAQEVARETRLRPMGPSGITHTFMRGGRR